MPARVELSPWYSVDQGPFSWRWPFSEWRRARSCKKSGINHEVEDRRRDVSVIGGECAAAEFRCGCLFKYAFTYGPPPEILPAWKP